VRRALLIVLLVPLLVLSLLALSLLARTSADAAPSAPTSFPGGPNFVLECRFSHRSNDDPIKYPDQPGLSHNHTFIGNVATDAASTPASLLGGKSTCDFPADSSAYWAPTLFAGPRPILPLGAFVYYVRRTTIPIKPFPAGLKIIAGNALSLRPEPVKLFGWSCGEQGIGPFSAAIPKCARNRIVQERIVFPNCWNGQVLDSANHRRHMAYSTNGRCPASHPVAVPTLILVLLYPETPPQAQVASGRFGLHADFMNGWDQTTLAGLVAGLNGGTAG
jgi:hypothetical protein